MDAATRSAALGLFGFRGKLRIKSVTFSHVRILLRKVSRMSLPELAKSSLPQVNAFAQKYWLRVSLLSAALLVPCFWHRHIAAGDLGSHVYNAWLAQLIEQGRAPGLYIAAKWNNVLFDVMLLKLGNLFGLAAAEKTAVSLCVLIFFWGVFALISTTAQRAAWHWTPCIAILAYGYVFNMGFFNFYLSIGLACFILALLWRGGNAEWILGACFVPFVFLAHPLGFLWLAGAAAYVKTRKRLSGGARLAVPATAVAGLFALHWIIAHRPAWQADWRQDSGYLFNGADQVVLYGTRYALLATLLFVFGVASVIADTIFSDNKVASWKQRWPLLELYVVSLCATWLLPENLRPVPDAGWIGLLVTRLTIISAIFGLCVIATVRPRWWHAAGFTVLAAVFFAFLWQDTAFVNRLETNAEKVASELPYGTRLLSTVWAPPGSRITFISHVLDRACIGHCFSYGNYEPSSKQFRVRVRPGSPLVTSVPDDTEDMSAGVYDVEEADLPLKQVYQCDEHDLSKLCVRDLEEGEKNGRIGYRPKH